jgi:hypothetical protein
VASAPRALHRYCSSVTLLLAIFGFVILTLLVVGIVVVLLVRRLLRGTAPVKNGLPGEAIIETIADTGITVTMPRVGPYAPEYRLGLEVTPADSGIPYRVEIKALIPRIYAPMIVPGARVGVLIDPTDPMRVSLDLSRVFTASRPSGW